MLEMTIVRTFLSLFWQLGLPIHSECASNSTRQNRTIFTKKSHGEFQGQFYDHHYTLGQKLNFLSNNQKLFLALKIQGKEFSKCSSKYDFWDKNWNSASECHFKVAIRVYHAFFHPTSRSISKRGKDSSWTLQCNVMLMVELPILHGTLQDNALSALAVHSSAIFKHTQQDQNLHAKSQVYAKKNLLKSKWLEDNLYF